MEHNELNRAAYEILDLFLNQNHDIIFFYDEFERQFVCVVRKLSDNCVKMITNFDKQTGEPNYDNEQPTFFIVYGKQIKNIFKKIVEDCKLVKFFCSARETLHKESSLEKYLKSGNKIVISSEMGKQGNRRGVIEFGKNDQTKRFTPEFRFKTSKGISDLFSIAERETGKMMKEVVNSN